VFEQDSSGNIQSVWVPPNSDSGGATPAQQASNAEIDSARALLADLEKSVPPGTTLADELMGRMRQETPGGRTEPDYNSYWGRIGWLAQQVKIGGADADQSAWSRKLTGMVPRVEPLPSGQGGQLNSSQLKTGAVYEIPDGQGGKVKAKWTGLDFEVVE
jgi:hypothetical protein